MTKKKNELKRHLRAAVAACESKKAEDIAILELDAATSGGFTDFFLLSTGANPRQVQAISDAVEEKLKKINLRPTHVEGYRQAEWVLLDYVDFVVHVFSERARRFYDLERLWKSARKHTPAELAAAKTRKPRARKAAKPRRRTKKA